MQALILAAGMGKRLGKYTKENTKCMVDVAGIKLVDRAVDAIRLAGIKRLVVVIGYYGNKVKEHLEKTASDLELRFVENNDYENSNNIYSLYLARHEFDKDDTILIESDLIYDKNLIIDLVNAPEENMAVVAKYEQWMDGTVVTLGNNGAISDFVEKVDFKFADVNKYFKTVNIYKFSKRFIQKQYIPFLDAYIKAYGKNQYYEMVLKILAHVRYSNLKAFILDKYNWYEIDDEQDLK
nr:phosphocholine cytidylyltransferase family protein [Treponema sp.]